jgi:hypothetical protein
MIHDYQYQKIFIEVEEDIFDEFYEILTMVLENMTMLFEGIKKGVDSIQDHSW